jgi:hypothetical protein
MKQHHRTCVGYEVRLELNRRIWSLAAVGVVFATPALYLGLTYFRR